MTTQFERFGKYILLEKLAAGGMAEVYLAKWAGAEGVNKFLSIKRILPEYSSNSEFINMFKEEAKIAINLNHSNVVSIYEFGEENNRFFIAMEYVEGFNLRQILNHIKKGTTSFNVDQIVFMIKEIAAGLDHAHRCYEKGTGKPLNIIHRDMSPQNIMVSFEGEIKIIDFGIAKAANQKEDTKTGTLKGKYGYMSPEQADGETIDHRTDIFSLGIILWELLANARLFTADSEAAVLRKIRDCQITNIRNINPSVPQELERIVSKALAKDKNLRYQRASDLHKDLNRFLNMHYPEFSQNDFSMFIKSLYGNTFIDRRKKLVEYNSVDKALESKPVAKINPMSTTPNVNQNLNQNSSLNYNYTIKSKAGHTKTGYSKSTPYPHTVTNATGLTRSKIHVVSSRKSNSSGLIVASLLAIASILIVWDFLPLEKKEHVSSISMSSNAPEQSKTTETISEKEDKEIFVVSIYSEPSGAEILINNASTGLWTPARQSLYANEPYQITIHKEGYLPYNLQYVAKENPSTIKATLQPQPMLGTINLNIKNPTPQMIVLINGKRIQEQLPLKNYAIPSDSDIHIRVQDPFKKISAETIVNVKTQESKNVSLTLTSEKR